MVAGPFTFFDAFKEKLGNGLIDRKRPFKALALIFLLSRAGSDGLRSLCGFR